MQFGNLPLAALKVLAARHPAVEQQRARAKLFAGADRNFVRRKSARFGDSFADRPFFLGADLGTLTQLLEVNADHRLGALCLAQRNSRLTWVTRPYQSEKSCDFKMKACSTCNTCESIPEPMLIDRHFTGGIRVCQTTGF